MPVRSGGWTDDTFVNHNQRPHGEIMKEMGLRRALIAYLFLALFSHLSIAQEAGEHRPSRIIIHAAKLLEVKTGNTLADQAIVIEGDKIVSVGPMVHMQRSTSDRLTDLPNATVLPGLTDAHTHLTGDPRNIGYQSLGISIPRATLTGARNARLTLEAGFTTVRNVGAYSYSDVALRDAINDGDIPGPRMLVSGPALGITGGHCDENLLPSEYHVTSEGVADGVQGVQHKVREVIKYGADLSKICATGGVLSHGDNPQASQYTLEEMKAIVADAHRLGRKVAAHAHGAQGILWASQAGVDSIEHGSYIDDASIAEMKKNGTYLVPTLYLADWFLANAEQLHVPAEYIAKGRAAMSAARKNVGHAFSSGVKVGFGTDAAVYPHGLNAHEFVVMVKLGLTPLQAIQSATVNDADLLGWSDKIGTIEHGKWADIIAVDGDRLADVSKLARVKVVMNGGELGRSQYAR